MSSPNFDMGYVRRTKLRCTMILKNLEKQKPATILRALEHVTELRNSLKKLSSVRLKVAA